MAETTYIHGTDAEEQERLAGLGGMTDEAFLRFLEFGPGDAVLDVGCGLGNLTRRVAGLAPRADVWGVERSAEQLARAFGDAPRGASGGAPAELPNLHFRQADAHELPFEDGRFDLVFCRYLLEHVADPGRVLREMWRVLKPGGRVFVQENNILINTFDPDCPHFGRLWHCFAKLQRMLGGDATVGKKLLPLLRGAGFGGVRLSIQPEVHWQGTPTFRPWVENLIGNVRPAERLLVEKGLATADEVRRGIDELLALLDHEDASAFFYWNRARGVKAG